MPNKLLTAICLIILMLPGCMSKTEKQARDAFLFGYPLVMTDETRQTSPYPVNTIQHLRSFPDHTFRNVVRPNVDTLYSIIWLDLADEAMVLTLPDSQDRYVLMPMLDAWSNVFASIGTQTTGPAGGSYVIAGPNWAGDVPEGLPLYRSPTTLAWMVGRIFAGGPEDFIGAHAYQDGMQLRTLSDFKNNVPMAPQPNRPMTSVDIKQKIKDMPAAAFFSKLESLMESNPPAASDAPFLEGVWRPLMAKSPSPEDLQTGKDKAYKRLALIEKFVSRGKGWSGLDMSIPLGAYGTDYQLRGIITHVGFGANEAVDAIYPNTTRDQKGKPLHSSKNYIVHFTKDELPPVNAFWSMTLYDDEGFLVENSLNRYALGTQSELAYNVDGSLDIYVQSMPPNAGLSSNWLPAPKDMSFALTMRLYWPKERVLQGDWTPPQVNAVK